MSNFETFPMRGTLGIAAGSGLEHQPRVITAEFGDGYVARAKDGLNSDPVTLTANFTNLTRAEAGVIDFFLQRMGAVIPFLFTLPGDSGARQFLCTRWKRDFVNAGTESINATFVENFDP